MSIITQAFEPMYGKIAWNVSKGVGSFLTFEFGEPHFEIPRQPKQPDEHASGKLKRHQARRLVTIKGDWHLWIYCCDWRFFSSGSLIGDSNSSAKAIHEIAKDLDGQELIAADVKPIGKTIFQFDLGGRLETSPNLNYGEKEAAEQWFLFEPSGKVLTFRADGHYSYQNSNSQQPKQWYPVGENSA